MELQTIIQWWAVWIAVLLIILLWKMFEKMMTLMDKKNGQLERVAQWFTFAITEIKNSLIEEIKESRKIHHENYKDILHKLPK